MKRITAGLCALTFTLAAGGCSSGSGYDSQRANIVVSNPVYWGLVIELEGVGTATKEPFLDLASLIDNQNVDPHEYEPSAKDRLLMANADLVIYSGTGVDPFVEPLMDSVGFDPANALNAYEHRAKVIIDCANPKGCPTPPVNPHIWYNVQDMAAFSQAITEQMKKLNPSCTKIYATAYKEFQNGILDVYRLQDKVRKVVPKGSYFFAPEDIANDFVSQLGLVSANNQSFSNKLANGVELSASEMRAAKQTLDNPRIKLFVANKQVESEQVAELQKYAKSKGIPIVTFSEMSITDKPLPLTASYQYKIKEVAKALGITVTYTGDVNG